MSKQLRGLEVFAIDMRKNKYRCQINLNEGTPNKGHGVQARYAFYLFASSEATLLEDIEKISREWLASGIVPEDSKAIEWRIKDHVLPPMTDKISRALLLP